MFRREKQELAYIVLPDKRIIKRRIYSKYVANNSPSWVKIKGIDFYIGYYDLNKPCNESLGYLYKIDWCSRQDFAKGFWAYILDGENVWRPEKDLLHVDISDLKYHDVINPEFWELVKR